MKVFLEAEVRGVQRKDFNGQIKYRTFLEDENGERLEVNSKNDYSEFSKKGPGVAKLTVTETNSGGSYFLTLDEFVPQTIE